MMKPAVLLAAGIVSASMATAASVPVHVEAAPTAAMRHAAGARLENRSTIPMTRPFAGVSLFGVPPQMRALPEQGTIGGIRDLRTLNGPGTVTGVRSGMLTFRAHTGALVGLRVPAMRISAMRITEGTRIRFTMLNNRQFELRVIGGRLLPSTPQRPSQ